MKAVVFRGFVPYIFLSFFILLPMQTAEALNAAANAMCNPWFIQCPCNMVPGPKGCVGGKNTANCPVGVCIDTTEGFTTPGICSAQNKCEGKTSSSPGGLGGASEALGLTKQIMDLLKGLTGAGGGGGGSEVPASQAPATVCPNGYYTVTQPSTDPCAVYNPNSISDALGGGTTGISGSLLDALNGDTGSALPTDTSTVTGGTTSVPSGTTQTPVSTPTNSNSTETAPVPPPATPPVVPATSKSLTGDIKIGGTGATVIANFKQGVTEVAGFFGGSTFGGGSGQSAASRVCASRPWAGTGLIASFVPNAFFDSMCSRAGYQVGVVQNTVTTPTRETSSSSVNTRVTTTPTATTTPPVRVNIIPPEVDIWAEPLSVRLGTRAYIFWNARGVDMCAASGPNFSQSSISGGASTVPISGATTFSIECTAPDGTKVTDSVTVNLAL